MTAPGLEGVTAAELAALGLAPGAAEPGGVPFACAPPLLPVPLLHLRTANRLLVRLAAFRASAFYELERKAKRIPWDDVLAAGGAVRFRVTSRKSRLYHEDAIAERLMESIAARVPGTRLVTGGAGEEDDDEPAADAQVVVVRVHRDAFTISADAAGALLHRRGYRLQTAKAPLRETLAAGLLLALGWDGSVPLVDPMCGSGTLAIEGALLARRIAPGLRRGFAAERWPAHDAGAWAAARAAAAERVLPRAPAPILGRDRDAGAIAAARANAGRAGVLDDLDLAAAPLSALVPPPVPGLLLTNPPYGVRVGEADRLRDLFAAFGRVARERLAGWTVAMLSGNPRLDAATGLPFAERLATVNGGLRVRLVAAALPAR